MSHNPSRKQFVAKLLGVMAAASVIPKVSGQPAPIAPSPVSGTSPARARRIELRHDSRAVARRDVA